ncbi:MAG: hypothetical protein ASARMPRED_003014 [Alectoria sarmentosa]|nr:MAG: hypothetical protein ASARMPRED_003014 [Alectoria sarmentosa]
MTSHVARNGGLSQQTHEAYRCYGRTPRGVDERLHFYYTYLLDVVPWGITVNHIPAERSNDPRASSTREEIQLLTLSGTIFMSGLVSMERSATMIETVAADEAYSKWLDGDFVPDDRKWRFFTGLTQIRFFESPRGDEWDLVDNFNLMLNAQGVAAFLQQEYNRLSFH